MKKISLFTLFMLLLSTTMLFSQNIPQDGLEVWYPFNGNTDDESGNGNDGINMGATPTADRFGNENSAMSFTGTSSGVSGDHIILPDLQWNEWSAFSISMWVNTEEILSDGEHFIHVGPLWPHAISIQRSINGFISFRISDEDPGYSVSTSGLYPQNAFENSWAHFVLIYDDVEGLSGYVNGELIGTNVPYPGEITYGSGFSAIARHWWNDGASSSTRFTGLIDDVAIYSRAITPLEVSQLNDSENIVVCNNPSLGLEENGWGYNDFYVPEGYKLDSLYADFDRPGYPESEHDLSFSFCAGCETYDAGMAQGAFAYADVTASLYDTWIDVSESSFIGPGIARVIAPINSSVVWHDLCYGLSEVEITDPCSSLYPSQSGLVAWYPFCGEAIDASGNGLDGVVNGASLVTDRFGTPNSAYFFDGEDDYISVNSSNNLLDFYGQSEISISAWIQLESINGQHGIVTNTQFEFPGQQYAFKIEDTGQLYFISGDGLFESNGLNLGVQVLGLSEWIHVVITYDGAHIRFYINGELDFENEVSDAFPESPSEELFIGTSWGINNANFHGKIDDIAIYNRALELDEILSLGDAPLCDPCTENYANGDINCDGSVNIIDFLILSSNFGWSAE